VVAVLGGGDAMSRGTSVAEQLSRLDIEVTLVEGPLVANRYSGMDFKVTSNPRNFSELLAGCAWAVTNGGGCMLEALYLDTPIVVLPQTHKELVLATSLYERDALLAIGNDGLRSYSTLELRSKQGIGPALIDGQGAKRIADIVGELCDE
jgi:spore coat polysaccharide biosynthesis predicted glycosyltransferase SpsG